MNGKMDYLNARKEYINIIKEEMLGPGSEFSYPDKEHEIITESPEIRYTTGILYPKCVQIKTSNDDTVDISNESNTTEEEIESNKSELLENFDNEINKESQHKDDDEKNSLDEEIAMASQNKPSSMGLIFFASGDVDTINLELNFGTYKNTDIEECCLVYHGKKPEEILLPDDLIPYVNYDVEKYAFIPNLNNRANCKKNFTKKYLKDLFERNVFEECDYLYDPLMKLASQISNSYIRTPHSFKYKLAFSNDYFDECKNIDGTFLKITALRRKLNNDTYVITLMLVNDADSDVAGVDKKFIFQPKVVIKTNDNNFKFCDYSKTVDISRLSLEEQSFYMQYRNKRSYVTGMGVSSYAEIDEFGNGTIESEYFPAYEVPQMDFSINDSYLVDNDAFKMKYLSDFNESSKFDKIKKLQSIVNAYEKWINELVDKQNENDLLSNGLFKEVATNNINACRDSLNRMKNGINILENDELVWSSFELANRAMFMQRAHLKIQNKYKDREPNSDEVSEFLENIDYREIDNIIEDYYTWRPFQIAFLLMSIDSIVNDESIDREIVDLIWFPTGGGKTEAYLGLTAFTIFFRKLKYPDESNGTAIIMRYTLRLLTAQQFTRASTLICACEYIRKDSMSKKPKYKSYPLGSEPISIGLWIGGDHTPNTISEAKNYLNKLTGDVKVSSLKNKLEKYNKFQVLKCPWCGESLIKKVNEDKIVGSWGYQCKGNHFKLVCPQEGCHFNYEGQLPIQIIDEELYNNPPTLLFGTVDKFAMITWNPKIGSFFGVGTKNRTPELIIQDELHLISGPLGTMVGAYETIIDTLCRNKKGLSKIIASTATIRGAEEQCSALYNRKVSQFPHPGLDVEDSFFAKESNIDYENDKFGRVYVGLMSSGKSKAMAEDRIIAALMERINMMELDDCVKDKYWTLTAYFNSLKELGKCSTLVEDDVVEFIGRTASRFGRYEYGRKISKPDELTSRITTTDLNETLDKLEKNDYKLNKKTSKPSDIVLATNMISVGIDISRLNVMLMVGQPKLTSEYIQASSRVGREYPGVSFVLYDSSRSRDRSHYEQFQQYHSSFYRYVEPTGITPFSEPARERTISSILIALMRNLEDELRLEDSPGNFNMSKYYDCISKIKATIIDRNRSINERLGLDLEDNSDEIENEIEQILLKWENWASAYKNNLVYGEKAIVNNTLPDGQVRLLASHGTHKDNFAFEAMTSMRSVDTELKGKVIIWEEDYE